MKTRVTLLCGLVLFTMVLSCERSEDNTLGQKESTVYYFELNENAPAGTVVGTVQFNNSVDNQPLVYSIVEGDPNGAFSIDPAKGEISVKDSTQIDYELQTEFNLLIQADVMSKCTEPNTVRALIEILDSNEIRQANLIAYYPLDGDANDVGPRLLHGELFGATPIANRFHENGKALYFDGADYITLPTAFDLRKRTICFWFKAEDVPDWNYNDDPDNSLRIIYTSDNPKIRFGLTKIWVTRVEGVPMLCFHNGGPDVKLDNSFPIEENKWYFAAVSVWRKGISYYLNGELVKSRSFPRNIHSIEDNGFYGAAIGVGRLLNHRFFKGRIDDFRIYFAILSPEEIMDIYKEKE